MADSASGASCLPVGHLQPPPPHGNASLAAEASRGNALEGGHASSSNDDDDGEPHDQREPGLVAATPSVMKSNSNSDSERAK